ncbi:four-carbon acid sugar kinase family protein, partial [Selenomonas sp.]|uniref:four-carbon acid sugar kinase family protein n=1 Tax=Selenomonas sp. TaxID=2053611 RepID=UPI001CB27D16
MKVSKDELFAKIPAVDEAKVDTALNEEREAFDRKIIVLDDDPTGVQTVNGIHVYTDWTEESIAAGFAEENRMFFILTNSRAFQTAQTEEEHRTIAARVAAEARQTGKEFMLISRSDSTLRGHYPLETVTLARTLEESGERIDGEVLMPFFKEGGRFTIGDVHYVQEGAELTPAGDTEFARDKTFGYTSSDMKEYIEEKTQGAFRAADVVSISLDDLRAVHVDAITEQIMAVTDFRKLIVNAVDYVDVK